MPATRTLHRRRVLGERRLNHDAVVLRPDDTRSGQRLETSATPANRRERFCFELLELRRIFLQALQGLEAKLGDASDYLAEAHAGERREDKLPDVSALVGWRKEDQPNGVQPWL